VRHDDADRFCLGSVSELGCYANADDSSVLVGPGGGGCRKTDSGGRAISRPRDLGTGLSAAPVLLDYEPGAELLVYTVSQVPR
jgi:hypothetical protein